MIQLLVYGMGNNRSKTSARAVRFLPYTDANFPGAHPPQASDGSVLPIAANKLQVILYQYRTSCSY